STDTSAPKSPATRSTSGTTRSISTSTSTGSAPVVADSPPMSITSAPACSSRRASITRERCVAWRPPSLTESGDAFTTPISHGRAPRSSTRSPARRSLDSGFKARAPREVPWSRRPQPLRASLEREALPLHPQPLGVPAELPSQHLRHALGRLALAVAVREHAPSRQQAQARAAQQHVADAARLLAAR